MQTLHRSLKALLILLASVSFVMAGDYPLKTCVVSGEKLGDAWKPG